MDKIARYGINIFGLRSTPLLCAVQKNSKEKLAATILKQNIEPLRKEYQQLQELNTKLQELHAKLLNSKKHLSDQDFQRINAELQLLMASIPENKAELDILEKLYRHSDEQQDTILLFPKIFQKSYGIKKAVILHELWHIKQQGKTLNPTAFPRGNEQEADMRAAYATNCLMCTKNFAQIHTIATKYATLAEILTVADSMPKNRICPYHKIILSKTRKSDRLPRLFGSSLAGSLVGTVGQLGTSGLAKIAHYLNISSAIENSSNFAKIIGATTGIATGLYTFVKSVPSDELRIFTEAKHGQSVEEQIARGEIEP
jgi:hypothetical protein